VGASFLMQFMGSIIPLVYSLNRYCTYSRSLHIQSLTAHTLAYCTYSRSLHIHLLTAHTLAHCTYTRTAHTLALHTHAYIPYVLAHSTRAHILPHCCPFSTTPPCPHTINSLFGGPLLGMFLLGMLSSSANAQSALIGTAVSFAFMLVVVVSAGVCSAVDKPATEDGTATDDATTDDRGGCPPVFVALGSLSYLWYATVGAAIVLAVGQGHSYMQAASRVGTDGRDRGASTGMSAVYSSHKSHPLSLP
jgi:hypothetical protein